jgi:hypothetical protein
MSHSRPGSPEKKPGSPVKERKPCTRYGVVTNPQPPFAKEERFAWQKPQFSSDSIYVIPDNPNTRNVLFGTSLRKDDSEAAKSSTGPGSYDFMKCYDHHSEFAKKQGNKFSLAARQSMAVKTPSPGAVYNLGNCYWNGPDKSNPIGFSVSTRKSLYGGSTTADADMFMPKTEIGISVTMAGRPKPPTLTTKTPGAVYDVHRKVDFRTGPSYSFGKGKGSRFKELGYLPEPENW